MQIMQRMHESIRSFRTFSLFLLSPLHTFSPGRAPIAQLADIPGRLCRATLAL